MWWIFGVTILILLGLIGWVVWLNWIDRATESKLGKAFDKYAGREEYEPRGRPTFRDYEEDGDDERS